MLNQNTQKIIQNLKEKKDPFQAQNELLSLKNLMESEFPELEWIVEKLIPQASLVAISAPPASCKTWLILVLAIAVAQGGKLFGTFPVMTSGPVLIIDEENGARSLKSRIKKLRCDKNLPIYFLSLTDFMIDKANIENLKNIVKEKGIKLIIIDALVRVHQADENNAMEMSRVLAHFKEFKEMDVTVVFTHHHRKPSNNFQGTLSHNMRGSSDILAAVECHIVINRNKTELVISQLKLRNDKELEPFKISMLGDDTNVKFEYQGTYEHKQEKSNKKEDVKIEILEFLENYPGLSKTKLLGEMLKQGVEIGRVTFLQALEELIEAGEVEVRKGPGNTSLCFLSKSVGVVPKSGAV